MANISLDQKDKLYWKPATCIIDLPAETVTLSPSSEEHTDDGIACYSLNGEWELAHGGEHIPRLCNPWPDAIKAPVPGTVHTALFEAGVIPDPMTEINDKIARQYSYKEWWYKKTFPRPKGVKNARLVFEGVCYQATFWLNGIYLGKHSGMFGGPEFDIEEYLQDENTLIVFIDNAPAEPHEYSEYGDFDTAIISMKMENGALAVIDNSRQAMYGYDQRAELFGSKGMVATTNDTLSTAVVSDANGVTGEKPLYFFLERYMGSFSEEVRQFVDCCVNDKETPVGIHAGLQSVKIALAAEKSANEGRPVKLSEIK